MKFIGCLAFALIVIFAVSSATNSTWGSRNWSDKLIFKQNVVVRGANFNLTFPARAGANTRKISFIFARDLNRLGNGGKAQVTRGGLGHKNVTIMFYPQASTGINMTAEIWGR